MSNKKTPSNERQATLHFQKMRRFLIIQDLQIRSLKRENKRLERKLQIIEQAQQGSYKFFFKLAYGFEVILNSIKNLFRRNK